MDAYVVYFANNITHSVTIVKSFTKYFEAIQYCNERGFKVTYAKKGTFYINAKGSYCIKTIFKR